MKSGDNPETIAEANKVATGTLEILNDILPDGTNLFAGTTNTCYTWYTVQSGDGCYSIEQAYEISLAQLQAWNPDLHADCGNLLLGDAYCVSGGNSTSATTTTTAT